MHERFRQTFDGHEQILCTLRNVRSFLGVFPSDLLQQSVSQSDTVIINADPLTEKVSHWLAVLFRPNSASAYYFDSYGFVPYVPDIQAFIDATLQSRIITRDTCRA